MDESAAGACKYGAHEYHGEEIQPAYYKKELALLNCNGKILFTLKFERIAFFVI